MLRHGPRVYRTALRMMGDPTDAQDIAQDAMLAGWKSLASFRGESSFSTWMYQIVTRLALNRLKRRPPAASDTPSVDLPDSAAGPAESAERAVGDAAVTRAVAQLPPAQRIAVVLHHFEGLPYAEVAKVTHSTVPAVRSHLFRARRTLAQALREWR